MLVFTLVQTFNWLNFLWIFYQVPVLNRFIPHGRAFAHAGVALFLILGLGLERLGAPGNKHLSRLWIPALFIEAAFFFLTAIISRRYGGTITWEYLEVTQRAGLSRAALAPVMALIALGGLALVLKSREGRTQASILIKPALLLEFLLTGFFILPRHRAEILDPHPEYLDFLSRIHLAEHRIQAVYSFRDWEKLKSPLQTGVLAHTRSPDAYITFSTLRYTEFLKALDDKAFTVRNGKVSDIQTLNILKRGDFVSPEKLPLMNLLNLKYLVGQNKNLKGADTYFIGYEYYRFSPSQGVAPADSFKELRINPPAQFGLYIYVKPGDQLVLELKNIEKQKEAVALELVFKSRDREALVYNQVVSRGEEIRIDLAPISNQAGDLVFKFMRPQAEAGGAGALLLDQLAGRGARDRAYFKKRKK